MGLMDTLKAGMDSAVQKAYDAQASLQGESWLKEVQNEDGSWKKLEGWKDQYEPKKEKPEKPEKGEKPEPTEAQKQRQDAATTLAINTVFSKIEDGVTMQIMNIMLEVASRAVGTTHELLSNDKTATEANLEILPVLSSLDIMLLSYRFDKTGAGTSNKFRFIRKQAVAQLSDVVYDMYAANKTPDEIASEVKAAFGEDKSHIRGLLLAKIDSVMKSYTMQMAAAADANADTTKNTEALNKARTFFGEGQDNVFAQFLSFMLVSKLEVVEDLLKNFIDEFMTTLSAEHEAKKTKEEVQASMFAFVDKKYNERLQLVLGEVRNYTNMAKAAVNSTPMAVEADVVNAE